MPRRKSNLGRRTRGAEAVRRLIANQTEEERASTNERERQRKARIRAEETAEQRAARLEDARLRARRSRSAASDRLRSQQNERDRLRVAERQRETANRRQTRLRAQQTCAFRYKPATATLARIHEQPYNIEECSNIAEPLQIFFKEEHIDEDPYNVEEPGNTAEPHQIFFKEEPECAVTIDPNASDPLDIRDMQAFVPASLPSQNSRLMQNSGGGCRILTRVRNQTTEIEDQQGIHNHNCEVQEDSNFDGHQLQA